MGVLDIVPEPGKPDPARTVVGRAGTRLTAGGPWEAGLVVEAVRYKSPSFLGAERIVSARKPVVAPQSATTAKQAAEAEAVGVG